MLSLKDKLKLSLPGKKRAVVVTPQGAPIFLLLGSLSGCSKKDALQYARGLAEQNVISPAAGRVQVFEDKAGARWVYEVHEGGIQFSIAEKVVAALSAGEPVRIELVNGTHLTIEEAHGELYSLVHPKPEMAEVTIGVEPAGDGFGFRDDLTPDEPVLGQDVVDEVVMKPAVVAVRRAPPACDDVSKFASTTPLLELFPVSKGLANVGSVILGVASALFVVTGLAFMVSRVGIFDTDPLVSLATTGNVTDVADNPATQLQKASSEAAKAGATIKALKKGPKGWSWELSQ